jgi:hypothetical protein
MLDPSGNLWVSIFTFGQLERLDASALPSSVHIGDTLTVGGSHMAWIP